MRNHWSSIALVLAVMAGVAVGVGWIPVKIPENWLAALWSQNMAAWVQGAGSIAAIITAVWLASRQASQAREAREADYARQRGDRIDGIAALMEDVYWQLKQASNAASHPDPMEWLRFILSSFDEGRLERATNSLSTAPIHEMGNWRLVQAAIEMREVGIEGQRVLARLKDQAVRFGAFEERMEVCEVFDRANGLMKPVVLAQARGTFFAPAYAEWKEHLSEGEN